MSGTSDIRELVLAQGKEIDICRHELRRAFAAAAEYKRIGISMAAELDLAEKERDIYLSALSKIAHYCYQSHGYSVEMVQTAKGAIRDGKLLRAGEDT